jgi:gallate decarboxylase subunit D
MSLDTLFVTLSIAKGLNPCSCSWLVINMKKDYTISLEEDGLEVTARIIPMGNDLLVLLTGGQSHIGAVAVSYGEEEDCSVVSVPGHREDGPTKGMAETLHEALGRNVTVVAGMHWDNLSKEGIETVLRLCVRLTLKIIEEIK